MRLKDLEFQDNSHKSIGNTEDKTYYKLRDEIMQRSIKSFESVSGFECSVAMMEQSIKSFKTDLYDYKVLDFTYFCRESNSRDSICHTLSNHYKSIKSVKYQVFLSLLLSVMRLLFLLFHFQLLANAYNTMGRIFEYQADFQDKISKLTDDVEKRNMELARENILRPQYFAIKFGLITENTWLKFLSGKTFVYRGDTTLR